jgi:hypothetical protein
MNLDVGGLRTTGLTDQVGGVATGVVLHGALIRPSRYRWTMVLQTHPEGHSDQYVHHEQDQPFPVDNNQLARQFRSDRPTPKQPLASSWSCRPPELSKWFKLKVSILSVASRNDGGTRPG